MLSSSSINFTFLLSHSFIEITSEDMCEIQPCLYLISCSDSNRFTTLQGKPNHTTYGHSQESHMATFHKQSPGFHTCNTYTRIHPSSESSLNQSFTRCNPWSCNP